MVHVTFAPPSLGRVNATRRAGPGRQVFSSPRGYETYETSKPRVGLGSAGVFLSRGCETSETSEPQLSAEFSPRGVKLMKLPTAVRAYRSDCPSPPRGLKPRKWRPCSDPSEARK
jgi:hypothetical protein